MTDAKPATDAKRLSDVPTDRLAHNFVGTLIQAEGRVDKWDALSAQLISMLRAEFTSDLDTERAARLAAEARVKVLTEALRRIDSLIPADCHLDGMADAALRGLLLMIGDQIAALKAREPANG